MAILTLTIDDTRSALLKDVFGHPEWTNRELGQQINTYLIESNSVLLQQQTISNYKLLIDYCTQ